MWWYASQHHVVFSGGRDSEATDLSSNGNCISDGSIISNRAVDQHKVYCRYGVSLQYCTSCVTFEIPSGWPHDKVS